MTSQNTRRSVRGHRSSTKRLIPAYRQTLSAPAARALHDASCIAVDEVFEDLQLLAEPDTTFEDGFLGMYYPQARLPRYTPAVARKLYVCIVLLGWQLAQRNPMLHACVAEELAGYVLIERARVLLEIDGRRADFADFEDEFFEDLDFEMLFDLAFDGIMESEVARWMRFANLAFADWCRPFGQRAIHPYLWPDLPVRALPRLIAPTLSRDLVGPAVSAQLQSALQVLSETDMTTGVSLQPQLPPRERAALHIAAVQVLDQCMDDLLAAGQRGFTTLDEALAASVTLALLPESFRTALLEAHPYVRTKAYCCTLVAVCWKLAQHEQLPLASPSERAAAAVVCEAAARILALASATHEEGQVQTTSTASLLAAWHVRTDGDRSHTDESKKEQQEPALAVASTIDRRGEPVGQGTWPAWFTSDLIDDRQHVVTLPHPYGLEE